jgi:predicted nucleic acid-binding protein
MILVDTNVIVDVINDDPGWAEWSRRELASAKAQDALAINDVVYSELSGGYARVGDLDQALEGVGIALVPTPRFALFVAGKAYQRYRRSGGTRTGVLPDFFIGAHAIVTESPLLTRDPRRYRRYFPGVTLIAPA